MWGTWSTSSESGFDLVDMEESQRKVLSADEMMA